MYHRSDNELFSHHMTVHTGGGGTHIKSKRDDHVPILIMSYPNLIKSRREPIFVTPFLLAVYPLD